MLLKWLEWHFVVLDHALDIYGGAIALVFMLLGIWLALKLARPKTVFVERPGVVVEDSRGNGVAIDAEASDSEAIDAEAIEKLGLSARELEVLQAMAEGLSNQEIASRLFVSLNTVKTHSSNIFGKLDVRRRTQAVETARRLKIISAAPVVPK